MGNALVTETPLGNEALQSRPRSEGIKLSQSRTNEFGLAPFVGFFVLTGGTFTLLRLLLPDIGYHVSALVSQVFGLTCIWAMESFFAKRKLADDPHPHPESFGRRLIQLVTSPGRVIRNSLTRAYWREAWFVVIANALLGTLMLNWLVKRIDFSTLPAIAIPFDRLFLVGGVLNILTVQLGGWPLQAFLILCVVILFDGTGDFGYYMRLVGLAYVGYLLLTLALLAINPFVFPATVAYSEINRLVGTIHPILGKLGEFWVLTLIAFGISAKERFSLAKCLMAAAGPSFLLLAAKLAYDVLLGNS